MKKCIITSLFLLVASLSVAQVGISTKTPKATLEVVGEPNETAAADGVLIPRLSGDQLRAKNTAYTADRTGAMVYVSLADTAPAGKTINVTTSGYYFFDGVVWQRVVTGKGSLYTTNDNITNNRTVELDGKTLAFSNVTGTDQVNQFSVDAPTLSVNASLNRVGIGTNTPTRALTVKEGDMRVTGALRDSNNSPGGNAQVLSTTETGTHWVNNVAITPTILGVIDAPFTPIPIAQFTYLRRSITLPPGRWIVNIGQIFSGLQTIGNTQGAWIRMTLSSSQTTNTLNSGMSFFASTLASIKLTPGVTDFDFASGAILVNNASGVNQTLYLRTDLCDISVNPNSVFFGNGSENYLNAQPIN